MTQRDSSYTSSTVSIRFEPRDIWVGLYWKRAIRHDTLDNMYQMLIIYVCIVPMLPIIISIPLTITEYEVTRELGIAKFFSIIKKFFSVALCRVFGHSKRNYFQGHKLYCDRCHRCICILDDEAIRALVFKTAEDISRAVINPRKVIKGRYGKVDR